MSTRGFKITVGAVAIFAAASYLSNRSPTKSDGTQGSAAPAALAEPIPAPVVVPPDPKDKFEISKMNWELSGFGTVALVTLTFNNQNSFAVKDPLIACSFYGKSGTLIDTKRQVVYQAFGPAKRRSVKDINLGFVDPQSSRAGCRILSVEQA